MYLFLEKLWNTKNKTPENIALSLLFYSFIIAMCIFAILHVFNIGLFAKYAYKAIPEQHKVFKEECKKKREEKEATKLNK